MSSPLLLPWIVKQFFPRLTSNYNFNFFYRITNYFSCINSHIAINFIAFRCINNFFNLHVIKSCNNLRQFLMKFCGVPLKILFNIFCYRMKLWKKKITMRLFNINIRIRTHVHSLVHDNVEHKIIKKYHLDEIHPRMFINKNSLTPWVNMQKYFSIEM